MSDPHSSCSDHDQDSAVHEPPFLQELGLLKPFASDVSSQCREGGLWSKSHPSMNLVYGSAKKRRPSGELSCELGLGVGENPRRMCRICHRHFSSGRALGGHMRVHGPLFQLVGTKRKRESGQAAASLNHMDGSDSKGSDISLLSSTNVSESQGFRFDGVEEVPIMTSDSDGEAVDDAQTSEAYVHQIGRGKGADSGSAGHYMGGPERDEHGSLEPGSTEDTRPMSLASKKRNPLYTLRHNPKKSSRFAEDEITMRTFLPGQDPTSRGSGFPSLERPRVCSECGKSFWSWKALFGHMRCHPERDWRGISPPDESFIAEERIRLAKKKLLFTESRLPESSELELDSEVENREFGPEFEFHQSKKRITFINGEHLTEQEHNGDDGVNHHEMSKDAEEGAGDDDAHRWWPTGKRSRRKPSMEGKAEQEQEQELFQREDATAAAALTSESGSLEEEYGETPNFLLMLAEAARTIERASKDLWPYDVKNRTGGQPLIASSAKQPRAAASLYPDGIAKYECSTCKKSFNSHQALGGHRASHRKMKGCFARNSVGDEIEDYTFISDDLWQRHAYPPAEERDMKLQQRKEHECSICHRMFLTGQALGGHKRCHYIGEKAAEAVSFTSSNKHMISEGGLSTKLQDVVEGGNILDLNMPAPIDEGSENAHVSHQLHLFHDKFAQESKQQKSSEEDLTLAPWAARKDQLQTSSSWEFDSSWAARGPAVAY